LEVKVSATTDGRYYLPILIRKSLGSDVRATSNQFVVAIYPAKADKDDVIRSLTLIIEDLRFQKDLEARQVK